MSSKQQAVRRLGVAVFVVVAVVLTVLLQRATADAAPLPEDPCVAKPPPLTDPTLTPLDVGRWRFVAAQDPEGNIVAQGLATTWDDYVTASGVSALPRGVIGCSLPTGRCRATRGTPFPRLPWRTPVAVYCVLTGRTVLVPLIDEGPAHRAQAGTGRRGSAMIDLTRGAWRALGLTPGTHEVRVRVPKKGTVIAP